MCRGEACIKHIYIYMTLLFHWVIAYCKTTKRIGALNFTNMNLPFVVINLLMVCLSIAGHTTQGYTGCHKHVCLFLGLILVASKRSGMLGQREYVALGISMVLCSTTDLVPTLVCLPFGASGFIWELGRCCNKCRWQDLVPNRGVPMGKGPHRERLWF